MGNRLIINRVKQEKLSETEFNKKVNAQSEDLRSLIVTFGYD